MANVQLSSPTIQLRSEAHTFTRQPACTCTQLLSPASLAAPAGVPLAHATLEAART